MKVRNTAVACVCAAIATLTLSAASADTADYSTESSDASLAAKVSQITDGRHLADLNDQELSALIEILPADGSTVAVPEAGSTATSMQALATTSSASVCSVFSQSVYIRQSSGYGGVGTKPTTSCTLPFRSVTMYTTVAKKNSFGWWLNQGNFVGSATSMYSYTNNYITVYCTNNKATVWNAVTEHAIVAYYGTLMDLYSSSGQSTLNCGT